MSEVEPALSEQELADLCALADGTLSPERRAAVEALVAASPELQEIVDRQRRALAATQKLARDPVPESLPAAVAAPRSARASGRGRASRLAPRLALAGAVIAVVAIAAVALTGGPGGPTVAEAAQLATRPPSGPAPGRVGGGARLAIGVEGVAFPDLLRSFGWRPVGVRRDRLDGHAATVVYYAKGARRLAYVIVGGRGLTRPSSAQATTRQGVQFQTLRVDGRPAVTWRRDGHTCVLIGAASPSELLALASWRAGGTLRY